MQFAAEYVETRTQFDDFTLVIPTFNRPELLDKLLNFCSSWLPNIIVLDSSDNKVVLTNSLNIAKKYNKVSHIKYDQNIDIASKLFNGLSLVKTEFFSFCADDDVIFQVGLSNCLRYIKSTFECVGVDGLYMNFKSDESNLFIGVEYAGGGVNSPNSILRMCNMLQNYESRFYGVYRVKEALKVFSYLVRIESLHFQELMQSNAIVLLGKVHRLPVFYAARQHGTPADLVRDKWQTYYWFAENPSEFFEHYLAYRQILADFFAEYGCNLDISEQDFLRATDTAHAIFFSRNCPSEYLLEQVKSYCKNTDFEKLTTENLLQEFKSKFRIKIEKKIRQITEFVNIGVSVLQMPWYLYFLNREIRSRGGPLVRCVPAKRSSWILGHIKFRSAFNELCDYLES